MLYYDGETQIRKLRRALITLASVLVFSVITAVTINAISHVGNDNNGDNNNDDTPGTEVTKLYTVLSVTDGDTIRIDYNGTNTPLRLIGIDTPETVDERTTVQCFGQESSDYLKAKLTGKQVAIEADPTQSDRDKYNRLLRYVYLNNEDVGLSVIANGYGHEFTYDIPYRKQSEYQAAEKSAASQNLGLWSPQTCAGDTTKPAASAPTVDSTNTPVPTTQVIESHVSEPQAPEPQTPEPQTLESQHNECLIKGNINNKGVKIYHLPGQQYYDETVISPAKGERYFCTEAEAQAAGWRRAKV